MNPNKLYALSHLLQLHTERGDKIIVFCDDVYCLWMYARLFKSLIISGEVRRAPAPLSLRPHTHTLTHT